ncbi:Hypothetical Protein FCC1311_015752 [Hondaea fermentalgiana]|uniref:Uncharacterized protein n=1 Tax=Hondaea fermentalgiana TaxID=2315210 RepID=A0A2R5G2V2_9STRA|nr:Hypothetical Protein FCC1311_015752 [Hondaea fermentalgiana]|eukprot:GBG25357.1 Hypothetical Protein FCC1311_015752 [Hondaea fermentalgiana]
MVPILPVDATVAEAIATEWHGTDADEVEVLVARFKQLRARRAGLELREKEQRGEPGASDAASITSGSQNAETLRHELAIARTKLGDANKADENLEASRTRINALRTKLDDIDGHIRDLRAVASATARVSSSSRPSESSNSASDETDQEAATAAAACDDFARKAAEFEAAKRTAVHSSANVRSLWEKVNDMRSRLETLQEEARVKQLVEAALRENMKQAVKAAGIPSTGGSVSSETSSPESHGTAAWQAHAMATSLALLVDQGGEMLLNDWKRAIAKALDLSSAKVIQFVYGLVANSLVSIDRAQKEARVIAHIA